MWWRQTGVSFVSLSISDIVRGEVGSSEVLLRDAFRAAFLNAPSIIFIDEFQVGVHAELSGTWVRRAW